MFTKLFLQLKRLPAWVGRAKREHPWLYVEFWAFLMIPAGIVFNLFSFLSDALAGVFMIGIPGLWILLQPFMRRSDLRRNRLFGASAASALPLYAMALGDVMGMLQIAVGRGAFEPAAFDVFYLLVVATVLRIPMLLLSVRPPYRGKAWVDQGLLLLSYALSVILYSLAVTL
jgi:hypothetical protein